VVAACRGRRLAGEAAQAAVRTAAAVIIS
jgi:hypothetical protein